MCNLMKKKIGIINSVYYAILYNHQKVENPEGIRRRRKRMRERRRRMRRRKGEGGGGDKIKYKTINWNLVN